MELIDREQIKWYGCNFENDSCKNRECSGCFHAECSHSQVMQIPTIQALPLDELQAMREEIEGYEEEVFHRDTTKKEYACVYHCMEIIDKYIAKAEVNNK